MSLKVLEARYGVYGGAATIAGVFCYVLDKFLGDKIIIPNRWFIVIVIVLIMLALIIPYEFIRTKNLQGFKSPRMLKAINANGRAIFVFSRSPWITYNVAYTVLYRGDIEYAVCFGHVFNIQDDGLIQIAVEAPTGEKSLELYQRLMKSEAQELKNAFVKPGTPLNV